MKLRVFLIVASCLSLLSWSAAANTAERYELRIPKGRGVNDSGHHYFTELMLQALRKAANGRSGAGANNGYGSCADCARTEVRAHH